MEHKQTTKKRQGLFGGNFSDILKNLFFLFIILQIAPSILSQIWEGIGSLLVPKEYVGYLSFDGMITDSVYYTKRIEEFEKKDWIKGVFLKIDSPGGYSGSCEAIHRELQRLKKKKPIVALVENMCGSGAYYIAAAADTIIAPQTSIVGSIGNYSRLPNVAGLLADWNVKINLIQSGNYKTVGSPFKAMTEQEKEHVQSLSDSTYRSFVSDVAIARGLDEKNEKIWADGKVFTGVQALEEHLIDAIGSYTDALDAIKKVANITQEIHFVTLKKRQSGIWRFIMGDEEYGEENLDMVGMTTRFFTQVTSRILSEYRTEMTS